VVIVPNDYHVHSCYDSHWVLGFYKLEALGVLMGSLEFCSPVLGELLGSCLCFFDAVVELQAMNGKTFNDFLIGKSK
jgi:hypothetical protein